MFEVIYLTGAPASGKSSASKALTKRVSALQIFEYGEQLADLVATRSGEALNQQDLRQMSAQKASPEDIQRLDMILINEVQSWRRNAHVIIDTHAVTKENYGFRITPFALKDFTKLNPTQIWVLYTSPEIAVERIGRDPQGRPTVTAAEAALHAQLQAMVATSYATQLGLPVYFFDTGRPLDELVEELACRFGPTNPSKAS